MVTTLPKKNRIKEGRKESKHKHENLVCFSQYVSFLTISYIVQLINQINPSKGH